MTVGMMNATLRKSAFPQIISITRWNFELYKRKVTLTHWQWPCSPHIASRKPSTGAESKHVFLHQPEYPGLLTPSFTTKPQSLRNGISLEYELFHDSRKFKMAWIQTWNEMENKRFLPFFYLWPLWRFFTILPVSSE